MRRKIDTVPNWAELLMSDRYRGVGCSGDTELYRSGADWYVRSRFSYGCFGEFEDVVQFDSESAAKAFYLEERGRFS